jgi:hypothetical protein
LVIKAKKGNGVMQDSKPIKANEPQNAVKSEKSEKMAYTPCMSFFYYSFHPSP